MRLKWLLMLLMAYPVQAASIARNVSSDGTDLISISGVLNEGDETAFREVAAAADRAIVLLDSEGGSVRAGLEIGRAIRLRGFATAVPPQTLCASACALTWLAGSPRFLDDTSKLGFHAAFRINNGKAAESGVGNALIGAYLNQLGLSERAVVFVTSAPPEGIEWLSVEKASSVDIAFDQVRPSAIAQSVRNPVAALDPLSTVTAFYASLSAADGETASAFVIPEKRGKGPFNEASIHSFFSQMERPLKLSSAALRSDGIVRVAYEYVTNAGKACDGRADVSTVVAFGKTLISKIRALDGC